MSKLSLQLCVVPAKSTKKRADERTRTADLTSLRVISLPLQGFAQHCKTRISGRHTLLRVAAPCPVLRSRWYQSGVTVTLLSALRGRPRLGHFVLHWQRVGSVRHVAINLLIIRAAHGRSSLADRVAVTGSKAAATAMAPRGFLCTRCAMGQRP